jgi:hypothetical protein
LHGFGGYGGKYQENDGDREDEDLRVALIPVAASADPAEEQQTQPKSDRSARNPTRVTATVPIRMS